MRRTVKPDRRRISWTEPTISRALVWLRLELPTSVTTPAFTTLMFANVPPLVVTSTVPFAALFSVPPFSVP